LRLQLTILLAGGVGLDLFLWLRVFFGFAQLTHYWESILVALQMEMIPAASKSSEI
jgi:hypothetical protein